MKKRIVFITDCVDVAYNELRATVLSMTKERNDIEIEPVVPVAPFSVINGNFILRLMAEVYPKGTIFSVILNPMKKRPARLIGRTKKKDFIFVGANTGVFDWFLRDFGVKELYELRDPGFLPFGGKFVHAPAVAQVATGKPLKELGKPFKSAQISRPRLSKGTVVHIDNFGLMKFVGKLPAANEGDQFVVNANGKVIEAVFAKRMMSRDDGEWVIYPGSSLGLPELGKVRSNGVQELNLRIGDKILFEKRSTALA